MIDIALIGTTAAATTIGAAITYAIVKQQTSKRIAEKEQALALLQQSSEQQQDFSDQQIDQLSTELLELKRAYEQAQDKLAQMADRAAKYDVIANEYRGVKEQLVASQSDLLELRATHESHLASAQEVERALRDKQQLLEDTEKRLQTQFENLANKIFEQKQHAFNESSQSGLNSVLSPLKDQLEQFKKQINDQHIREGQERASLKTEILGLKALNQKITEEAAALTQALKGDNKQQGNWGEVVLERILKESGLREGHEFHTQVSQRNDEGKLYQPDVVVHLPNDKDVIIDSKVSLSGYESYFNSDNELDRQASLLDHINSLKTHIKGLGAKDYHQLPGIRTLDYVLMFIPIESAFLLAVEEAPDLVNLALNNNILLVSPTNLLVALRTINNIWQYEYQNQNAQVIAERAAKLYDKFANFLLDMERVGKSFDAAQNHFDAALKKLSTGRGSLVTQVEQFKSLGVQPSKQLPDSFTKALNNERD